jgi:tellurite resistance protein TerC
LIAEIALTGLPSRGLFTARKAAGWVAVYVTLAAAFGIGLGVTSNWVTAGQFYAGYLTEYSLSLDNLFIFYVIMGWFAVPSVRQHRVLLFGIGLALLLRTGLIVAGTAALNRFQWLFYPLAAVLIWTAVGLVRGHDGGEEDGEDRHTRLMSWLRQRLLASQERGPGRRGVSPMLMLAAAIGLADVLFAVDSIPAVFGITTNAYLVVACNVFALMGLRQLYALLARVLDRIVFLNAGLAVICGFIGVKLLLHALRGSGAGWSPEIPPWLSVTVTVAVLVSTVTAGMVKTWLATRPGHRAPLTAEERTVLERRFAVMDIDGNGVWQRADYQWLTRRLCEAFGHPADSGPAQAVAAGLRVLFDALLSHMDANGDQEISREEFFAALGRTVRDRTGFDSAVRAAASALLQVADTDGNGVLDPGEYTRLAAVYGARAEQAARAFDRLDRDHSGTLDLAELSLAIGQFFTSRDPQAGGNVVFGYL